MREMMLTHKDTLLKPEEFEKKLNHNIEDVQLVFEAIRQLSDSPQPERKRIGYRRKGEQA